MRNYVHLDSARSGKQTGTQVKINGFTVGNDVERVSLNI